jgi:hypothetical protein
MHAPGHETRLNALEIDAQVAPWSPRIRSVVASVVVDQSPFEKATLDMICCGFDIERRALLL